MVEPGECIGRLGTTGLMNGLRVKLLHRSAVNHGGSKEGLCIQGNREQDEANCTGENFISARGS